MGYSSSNRHVTIYGYVSYVRPVDCSIYYACLDRIAAASPRLTAQLDFPNLSLAPERMRCWSVTLGIHSIEKTHHLLQNVSYVWPVSCSIS